MPRFIISVVAPIALAIFLLLGFLLTGHGESDLFAGVTVRRADCIDPRAPCRAIWRAEGSAPASPPIARGAESR